MVILQRKGCYILLGVLLLVVLSSCGQTIGVESYPTYVFTHSEIVLFSYANGTSLRVSNESGRTIWRGRLDAGQYRQLRPGSGVYYVVGSHPYATLVGDPTRGGVLGYYALDQHGLGTSHLFYTYQSEGAGGLFGMPEGARAFVVFAYQDNTQVTIKETDTGNVVWQGTLNDGEAHFEFDLSHIFLTVEATQPVSALSYTDQGYYVPADDGKFIGRKFYTWAGNAGNWTHDLNVIAYHDNTSVTINNHETGEVLWQGTLDTGQIHTLPNVNQRLLSIETSEPVAVSVSPTISYAEKYAHMLFAQDDTGMGIGRKFYYPTIGGARLQIFAYEDAAAIEVRDADGVIAYQGVLNRGESATLDSIQTLYTINSTQAIASLMDWGDQAGANFAPPYYATSTALLPTIILPRWVPFVIGLPLLLLALWGGWQLMRPKQRRGQGAARPQSRSGTTSSGGRTVQKPQPQKRGASITHDRPTKPSSR